MKNLAKLAIGDFLKRKHAAIFAEPRGIYCEYELDLGGSRRKGRCHMGLWPHLKFYHEVCVAEPYERDRLEKVTNQTWLTGEFFMQDGSLWHLNRFWTDIYDQKLVRHFFSRTGREIESAQQLLHHWRASRFDGPKAVNLEDNDLYSMAH